MEKPFLKTYHQNLTFLKCLLDMPLVQLKTQRGIFCRIAYFLKCRNQASCGNDVLCVFHLTKNMSNNDLFEISVFDHIYIYIYIYILKKCFLSFFKFWASHLSIVMGILGVITFFHSLCTIIIHQLEKNT